jgi:hypothetical protein
VKYWGSCVTVQGVSWVGLGRSDCHTRSNNAVSIAWCALIQFTLRVMIGVDLCISVIADPGHALGQTILVLRMVSVGARHRHHIVVHSSADTSSYWDQFGIFASIDTRSRGRIITSLNTH